jgi:hypothetical protein
MLQWWADYVEGLVNESKVIVGNFGGISLEDHRGNPPLR